MPNLKNLLLKRIYFSSYPGLDQITLCEGAGRVEFGEKCYFGFASGGFNRKGSVEIQARYENSVIKIGDDVLMNNNVMLCSANLIEIGDHTLIGQNVVMMDHEAHGFHPEKRRELGEIGSISIGKNVWIGNNVVILKNSIVGENSIIAAGAVVSGVFPSNVVIGGVPAKIIKEISC